mmetsp:Transcript_45678/g.102514  ORF Transcript_45678/g.102514 Transcript_45678/m.102514 type:complete len:104 (+) Transcript_45678:1181-1492(+)
MKPLTHLTIARSTCTQPVVTQLFLQAVALEAANKGMKSTEPGTEAHDWKLHASNLQIPVLLVASKKDSLSTWKPAEVFMQALKNSQIQNRHEVPLLPFEHDEI